MLRDKLSIYTAYDLIEELLKDPGSHLFAAIGSVRPQSYEERALYRLHNAVIGVSQAKPADKRKAMIQTEVPKVAKEAKKQTAEMAQERFNYIKINGKMIDIITGEPIDSE